MIPESIIVIAMGALSAILFIATFECSNILEYSNLSKKKQGLVSLVCLLFVVGLVASAVFTGVIIVASDKEVINPDEIVSNDLLRAISSDVYSAGNVRGFIFITSGQINSVPVYTYYYLNENGNYVQKSIPVKSTEIKISESVAPCVIKYHDTVRGTLFGFIDKGEWFTNERYVIIIPENGLSTEIYLE